MNDSHAVEGLGPRQSLFKRSEVTLDLSVVAGSVGAALVMAIAAVADLDSQRSLVVCVVLGLVSVAALTYYATLHHRLPVRLAMSAVATVLCIVIVGLENTV